MPPQQMVITTYEIIVKLEREGLFKKLLGSGVIPVRYLNDKEMYECYLAYIEKGRGKMDAYAFTGIDFNCSSKTVERVVIRMES